MQLTSREADLLHLLLLKRNESLSRNDILQTLWGNTDYFSGRSLDVFISKLRRYFSSDPSVKIINVRGIGYKLISWRIWKGSHFKCLSMSHKQQEKEISICIECKSEYYKGSSQMASLCPNCSHLLYGYDNCPHQFVNGRCSKCFWNGAISIFCNKN